jgi:hypothetical protein
MSNIISNFFSGKSSKTAQDTPLEEKTKLHIPEDSTLRRHFLTQLRAEIENTLTPDMSDPSLRHYYEASIAAEYQKRLAEISG